MSDSKNLHAVLDFTSLQQENQKLKNHIDATIKHLHYQCEQYGTNTWDDDLHMVDIIDKYLMNDVDETIRKLKEENERLIEENQKLKEENERLTKENERLNCENQRLNDWIGNQQM